MNGLRVEVISKTQDPQKSIYAAMHQCYSEDNVFDEMVGSWPSESRCGAIAVDRLLKGNRGHFGCLENTSIMFNVIGFPHSTMQQARTHRIATFDVQSGRYTGERVEMLGRKILDKILENAGAEKRFLPESIEAFFFEAMLPVLKNASCIEAIQEVFYFRPADTYIGRQGSKYEYMAYGRLSDIAAAAYASICYTRKRDLGFSHEHAREMIPYCIRQDFTCSFNPRSLMHFLDLRSKADAQIEIQQMSNMMFEHFKAWMPEIADWYEKNRLGKAILAP